MTPLTSSSRPIKRVGLVAKTKLKTASTTLVEIARFLEQRGVEPVFETKTRALAGLPETGIDIGRDDLPRQVDMLVVLGGDGTLLGMADRIAAADADIPILGVNFGGLGFLTEVTLQEVYPSLDSALAGSAPIDERLMLRARTIRGDQTFEDRSVLNDIVITKGALSGIIDLAVWVDDTFVANFKADGLIVAAPTGSTAYNLSAGGPIVHPAVEAIVLTPIAPHTLTNRPIVIPAKSQVHIRPLIGGSHDEIFISYDGQFGFQLKANDVVVARCADRPLKLIRASTRTYFEVLREKLKWAER